MHGFHKRVLTHLRRAVCQLLTQPLRQTLAALIGAACPQRQTARGFDEVPGRDQAASAQVVGNQCLWRDGHAETRSGSLQQVIEVFETLSQLQPLGCQSLRLCPLRPGLRTRGGVQQGSAYSASALAALSCA